jgi:hypothetical protein
MRYFYLDVNPQYAQTATSQGTLDSSRRPRLILGPLPVDDINCTLGLELEPGQVVLTGGAQIHAMREHPIEYPICLPHLASVIIEPVYVGDDFDNPGKIEIIGFVPQISGHVLIAVGIERNKDGNFHVRSFYPVSRQKIQNRREKGFLRQLKKMGPN